MTWLEKRKSFTITCLKDFEAVAAIIPVPAKISVNTSPLQCSPINDMIHPANFALLPVYLLFSILNAMIVLFIYLLLTSQYDTAERQANLHKLNC